MSMTPLALGVFLSIWVEGENFKTAPQGLDHTVGPKLAASGANCGVPRPGMPKRWPPTTAP